MNLERSRVDVIARNIKMYKSLHIVMQQCCNNQDRMHQEHVEKIGINKYICGFGSFL